MRAALVAEPWAQARHQALEILRRPMDTFEAHVPDVVMLRRWAILVVAGSREGGADPRPVRRPAWLVPAAE